MPVSRCQLLIETNLMQAGVAEQSEYKVEHLDDLEVQEATESEKGKLVLEAGGGTEGESRKGGNVWRQRSSKRTLPCLMHDAVCICERECGELHICACLCV